MTEKNQAQPVTAISITAAWVAIATAILYQVLLIILVFLRPDLDPTWHTISEWVIGPYGWLMRIAFFTWAVSYTALFVMLKSQLRGRWGKTGLVLLLICVIGTFGVGIFTTDPLNENTITMTGILHTITGTAGLMLFPFAALCINLGLALKNEAWSVTRQVLLWTAGLPLLGWAGFVIYTTIFVVPLGDHAFGPGVNIGLPPRFAMLSYMAWTVILAGLAIKVRRQHSSTYVKREQVYPA
jgi:Protein of unknown function (DUF998)